MPFPENPRFGAALALTAALMLGGTKNPEHALESVDSAFPRYNPSSALGHHSRGDTLDYFQHGPIEEVFRIALESGLVSESSRALKLGFNAPPAGWEGSDFEFRQQVQLAFRHSAAFFVLNPAQLHSVKLEVNRQIQGALECGAISPTEASQAAALKPLDWFTIVNASSSKSIFDYTLDDLGGEPVWAALLGRQDTAQAILEPHSRSGR